MPTDPEAEVKGNRLPDFPTLPAGQYPSTSKPKTPPDAPLSAR